FAGPRAVADRLAERLGVNGLGDLVRYLQPSREAGLLVAEGGEAAAAALHEARGNVPKAQAWLSEAKSQRAGPTSTRGGAARSGGNVAALVHEAAGFTREAAEARLLQAELEATGPRLPADVKLLMKLAPRLEAPPPGVRQGSMLWGEYVTYRKRRLAEVQKGESARGPLKWEGYEEMRGQFARGLEFERDMVSRLRADAALPPAQRQWLQDFNQPRIETHVGVAKEGVAGTRYADVLVIEERPPAGQLPRVETFSCKSRDLSSLRDDLLEAQMRTDARDALRYYGETLNIRRPELELLEVEVRAQRVHLIYDAMLKPENPKTLTETVDKTQNSVKGVEVSFQ
ncbi:hypothetical protein ACLESO_06490, partial [Pyxidicoccus sp. 3LG]